MSDPTNLVARWETTGKDWIELIRCEAPNYYCYKGHQCGGGFRAKDDEDAIHKMNNPWGHPEGAGPVTVLQYDRPSLRRVK